MHDPMIWFDHSDQRDLITKIRRAAEYYYDKRGKYPDECHLHPDLMGDNPITIPGMSVAANPLIYRGHLAVGMADQSVEGAG